MVGAIVAAVAGAVGGSLLQGITTIQNNKKLAKAYQKAADQIRDATEKYSGQNLYEGMRTAGDEYATKFGRNAERTFTSQANPGETANSMSMANDLAQQAAANAQSAAQAGRQAGMSNEKARKDTQYNASTIAAQQALKQAGIDYNVAQQGMQEALGGAAGLAQLGANLFAGMKGNKTSKPGMSSNDYNSRYVSQ